MAIWRPWTGQPVRVEVLHPSKTGKFLRVRLLEEWNGGCKFLSLPTGAITKAKAERVDR